MASGMRRFLLAGSLAAAMLTGCVQPGRFVHIHHHRPAEYAVPPGVQRLAVAPFVGRSADDEKWGRVALAELAKALAGAEPELQRYEVYPPGGSRLLADDPQLGPVTDSVSARRLGQLAGAHATVYGTVGLTCRDETGAAPGEYLRRRCSAELTVRMNDVRTGGTIVSVVVAREYDSSATGHKPLPVERIAVRLIRRCVAALLDRIRPSDKKIVVKLADGQDRIVSKGNKLAEAGQYESALVCYQTAIARIPRDHGALFNSGVVHEAKGEYRKAARMYRRAVRIEKIGEYEAARRRVRTELEE